MKTAQPEASLASEPPAHCSCHPDDNPPAPCPRKHALRECRRASFYAWFDDLEVHIGEGGKIGEHAAHSLFNELKRLRDEA